jgi:hypothetical protein
MRGVAVGDLLRVGGAAHLSVDVRPVPLRGKGAGRTSPMPATLAWPGVRSAVDLLPRGQVVTGHPRSRLLSENRHRMRPRSHLADVEQAAIRRGNHLQRLGRGVVSLNWFEKVRKSAEQHRGSKATTRARPAMLTTCNKRDHRTERADTPDDMRGGACGGPSHRWSVHACPSQYRQIPELFGPGYQSGAGLLIRASPPYGGIAGLRSEPAT